MSDHLACPQCTLENTYPDGVSMVCADCGFEWTEHEKNQPADEGREVRDANGTLLVDGDSVTIIKDLKAKGSSNPLKRGTQIKGIRIVDGDHEIDCKINGVGFLLKACFLRKA